MSVLHSIRDVVGRRLGVDVQRYNNGWARAFDPAVRTVIDVGVGYGTKVLYDAFPDADLLLVEPLLEFEQGMRSILDERHGSYALMGASREAGRATIRVDEISERTSLQVRSNLTAGGRHFVEREIPITTLDRLVEERKPRKPFAIKIDTEGNELDVLIGAQKALRDTRLVIAEVSVAKRFEGSYRFEELIAFMSTQEFALADIISLTRLRNGQAVFIDALFISHRCEDP